MPDKKSATIGSRLSPLLRHRLNEITRRYGPVDATMLQDALSALADYVEAAGKYARPIKMVFDHEADQFAQQVAEEQAPYGAAAEPIGIVETDAERRVTAINAGFTAICGYVFDEVRGKNLRTILQRADIEPATIARLRASLAARESFQGVLTNYHKNGEKYFAALNIIPTAAGFVAEVRRASPPPEGEAKKLLRKMEKKTDSPARMRNRI